MMSQTLATENLLDLAPSAALSRLLVWLSDRGEASYRAAQIFARLWLRPVRSFDDITELPKGLREALAASFVLPQLELAERQTSTDGTEKFLFRMADGQLIETVSIPDGDRITLCISSQAGCALQCAFCATGAMGFQRNLQPSEIAGQVRELRLLSPPILPTNIVFMGMGEPTDNLDVVLDSIQILVGHDGGCVPATNITISTVGNPHGIARIGELVNQHGFHKLNLAVSLNAPNDAIRSSIMPVNRAWNMETLRDAIVAFPKFGKGAMCIEYVLIPGVNDAQEHCDEVCEFLKGIRCSLNVIPYNPRRNSPWGAPSEESVLAFIARAIANGQFTKRRGTKGRSQMAACGQLGNEEIRKRKFVGLGVSAESARESTP